MKLVSQYFRAEPNTENAKSLDLCAYSKLLLCLPLAKQTNALIPARRPSNLGARAPLTFGTWQTLTSTCTWEAVVNGAHPSQDRKLSLCSLKRKQREATTSNLATSSWALNAAGELPRRCYTAFANINTGSRHETRMGQRRAHFWPVFGQLPLWTFTTACILAINKLGTTSSLCGGAGMHLGWEISGVRRKRVGGMAKDRVCRAPCVRSMLLAC